MPLVVGNWKMNTSVPDGLQLASRISDLVMVGGVEVVILPPFTHLWSIAELLRGSHIGLGAQDVFWEPAGAFTGEISPTMLSGWCDWVLVGHSERRHLLKETNADVRRKLDAALAHELSVIVAVGETGVERDADHTEKVITRQLDAAFSGRTASDLESCVVAYEPVWAIGSGRTATPDQAEQVCQLIRQWMATHCGEAAAQHLRVLYGGSVNDRTARELFAQSDIDGGLIGGASLEPDDFAAIVMAADPVGEASR